MITDSNTRLRSRRGSIAALIGSMLVAGAALSTACSSDSRDGFTPPKTEEEPQPSFDPVDAGEPPDGGSKCVSDQVQGESVPLSMVILLDRSGSMTTEMWTSATNAIRAFVDRAEVVGMKVGLQFFPPLSGEVCDPAVYANLSVPIAPLPDNVLPIQQRLASTSPLGGTPMSAALEGGINALRTWLDANDPHAGAVILVTDGDPSGCGGLDAVVSTAASAAKPTDDSPPIRTFAVGMQGATFKNLDKVAVAGGGSQKAFNVGGGAAAQQALLEALETIRTGAISCEYVLPVPPASEGVLDLNSVEMNFSPGQNDPTVTIRRVADKDACGATTGGFYYDDPEQPRRLILCPATCKAVREGTAEAKVDVVLGCVRRPD